MAEKFVSSSEHCFVVIETTFNHKHIIKFYRICFLHFVPDLLERCLVNYCYVKLSCKAIWVIRVSGAPRRLPIVNLLIGFTKKVIKLITEWVVRLAHGLCYVVAHTVVVVFKRLAWRFTR